MSRENDMSDIEQFQVGDLIDFGPLDPVVTGWELAIDTARNMAGQGQDERPMGIWRVEDHDAELVGIFYLGDLFTP